jgi:hypothetical protein
MRSAVRIISINVRKAKVTTKAVPGYRIPRLRHLRDLQLISHGLPKAAFLPISSMRVLSTWPKNLMNAATSPVQPV